MRDFFKPELSSQIIKLATPAVLGMLSHTVLNIVDTAMVGRLNPESLAASSLGGLIVFIMIASFGALSIGIQTLASRRCGEKKYHECGVILHNALLISVVMGIALVFFGQMFAGRILAFFTVDQKIFNLGVPYIKIRYIGIGFYMIGVAYRGFFNGIGKTRVFMYVAISMNLFNAIANYLFIFGKHGFPAMGLYGAGLGSALANLLSCIMFVGFSFKSLYIQRFNLYRDLRLDYEVLKRTISLSIPAALEGFILLLAFLIFQSIIGKIGTMELAASTITITIYSLSYMPAAGLGIATAVLVGQNLGAKRPELAETYVWHAVKLGILVMISLQILMTQFPHLLLRIFTNDVQVIHFGEIAVVTLGIFIPFEIASAVLSHAIQGAGNTKWVMIVHSMISIFIFLPTTYLLAFTLNLGLMGAWLGNGLYLIMFFTVCSFKFRKGDWKTISL